MTIFIYSNSFIERTLACNINSVFKMNIDKIYFLKENHAFDEHYCTDCAIVLEKNMETCVAKSDFVLLINSDNIPDDSIDAIRRYTTVYNKKLYIIQNYIYNNSDVIDTESCHIQNDSLSALSANRLVILTISFGHLSQSYQLEMILDKVFKCLDINFKHIYTKQTYMTLEQFDKLGLACENIHASINWQDSNVPYDVLIYSLFIPCSIFDIKKYIYDIQRINADYIILQTDANYKGFDTVKWLSKHASLLNIDAIISSHYLSLGDDRYVYCKSLKVGDSIKDLESEELSTELAKDILFNITLPDGIYNIF